MSPLISYLIIIPFVCLSASASGSGRYINLKAENKFFSETEVWQDSIRQVQVPLYSGDTLTTGGSLYAEVMFLNQSRIKVAPYTQLVLTTEKNRGKKVRIQIEIKKGSLYLELNKQENIPVELITATTVATVENGKTGAASTGFYWVEDGSLEIVAIESGQDIQIHEGMFAQISEEGNDILTGQLVHRQINQLHNQVELASAENGILRFFYHLDEEI